MTRANLLYRNLMQNYAAGAMTLVGLKLLLLQILFFHHDHGQVYFYIPHLPCQCRGLSQVFFFDIDLNSVLLKAKMYHEGHKMK